MSDELRVVLSIGNDTPDLETPNPKSYRCIHITIFNDGKALINTSVLGTINELPSEEIVRDAVSKAKMKAMAKLSSLKSDENYLNRINKMISEV